MLTQKKSCLIVEEQYKDESKRNMQASKYRQKVVQKAIDISVQLLEANNLVKIIFHL